MAVSTPWKTALAIWASRLLCSRRSMALERDTLSLLAVFSSCSALCTTAANLSSAVRMARRASTSAALVVSSSVLNLSNSEASISITSSGSVPESAKRVSISRSTLSSSARAV